MVDITKQTLPVFTQADYDAMPVITPQPGALYPSGDYTAVQSFNKPAVYGAYSRFPPQARFQHTVEFGKACRFEFETVFEQAAEFGSGCTFGENTVFARACWFGNGVYIGNGSKLRGAEFGKAFACGTSITVDGLVLFGAVPRFSEGFSTKFIPLFSSRVEYVPPHVSFGGFRMKPGQSIIVLAGMGTVGRIVNFFDTEDGIMVATGCFFGTLEQFRTKVQKEQADPKERLRAIQYLGMADLVEATWDK